MCIHGGFAATLEPVQAVVIKCKKMVIIIRMVKVRNTEYNHTSHLHKKQTQFTAKGDLQVSSSVCCFQSVDPGGQREPKST